MSIPLYCRIRDNFRDLITQGELKPGDALPPEIEIGRRFGVSRMTVRQALQDLVNDNVLYRHRGKGTFVREQKIEPNLSRLTSFTEDMRERSVVPSTRLLSQKKGYLPAEAARRWNLPADERMIITRRLRFADGEPICINVSHVPFYLCPGLLREDLEKNSIKTVLASKYGLPLYKAEQTIETAFARAEEARMLRIRPGSPVFLVERVTYLEDGRLLDFTINKFRTDKYKFRITISK